MSGRFKTVYELAKVVNRMQPFQCLKLDAIDMGYIRWNDILYGSGLDGFARALRGNVIGSSFGTVEVREGHVPPFEVTIVKHREGKRIYDRDGYSIRKQPMTLTYLPTPNEPDPVEIREREVPT